MESKKYKSLLENNKAIMFTNHDDVKWLTQFSSSNMVVFYVEEKWFAVTDKRYAFAATQAIKNMEVLFIEHEPLERVILPLIKETEKKLVIDSHFTTIAEYNVLKTKCDKEGIKIQSLSFVGLREIKSKTEINQTKEAVELTDQLFSELLNFIKVGMNEIEITKFIEKRIIDLGGKKAFDPIVAAGINGSKPHHRGSNYEISAGDMVTIDMGMHIDDGMCSDMTRTIAVGKEPSEEEVKIYAIVKKAMEKAIKEIKPGITGKQIDKIARNYIKEQGYNKYFTHGTGHGLGINVHEEPRINHLGTKELESGMLITIEPGIYIDGKYGVRIEQDVLVTENGYEVLNKSNTKLMVISNETFKKWKKTIQHRIS